MKLCFISLQLLYSCSKVTTTLLRVRNIHKNGKIKVKKSDWYYIFLQGYYKIVFIK